MSSALSLTEMTGALRGVDLEAAAERTWGFVCRSLNYSDAFCATNPEVARRIVRRFPGWRKDMDAAEEDRFLLLSNLEGTTERFLRHVARSIPDVADMLAVGDPTFQREVRAFLAMKVFEEKAARSTSGRVALFSSEGYRAALSLVIRKDQRGFAHEALGRSRKYTLGGGADEERIREIVQEVWDERFGELLRGVEPSAPPCLPEGMRHEPPRRHATPAGSFHGHLLRQGAYGPPGVADHPGAHRGARQDRGEPPGDPAASGTPKGGPHDGPGAGAGNRCGMSRVRGLGNLRWLRGKRGKRRGHRGRKQHRRR